MTCSYCHDGIELTPDDPVVTCDRCHTLLHASCASAHGRCPTLACAGTFGPSPLPPGRQTLAFVAPPPGLARELAGLPLHAAGLVGALATALAAWLS